MISQRDISSQSTTLGHDLWKETSCAGVGLVAWLLQRNLSLGTHVWTNAGLNQLHTTTTGGVVGAVIERDGKKLGVQAKRGIILAASGFSRNPELRDQFLRKPTDSEWGLAAPEDKVMPSRLLWVLGQT
jgi:hypothetical protein